READWVLFLEDDIVVCARYRESERKQQYRLRERAPNPLRDRRPAAGPRLHFHLVHAIRHWADGGGERGGRVTIPALLPVQKMSRPIRCRRYPKTTARRCSRCLPQPVSEE